MLNAADGGEGRWRTRQSNKIMNLAHIFQSKTVLNICLLYYLVLFLFLCADLTLPTSDAGLWPLCWYLSVLSAFSHFLPLNKNTLIGEHLNGVSHDGLVTSQVAAGVDSSTSMSVFGTLKYYWHPAGASQLPESAKRKKRKKEKKEKKRKKTYTMSQQQNTEMASKYIYGLQSGWSREYIFCSSEVFYWKLMIK